MFYRKNLPAGGAMRRSEASEMIAYGLSGLSGTTPAICWLGPAQSRLRPDFSAFVRCAPWSAPVAITMIALARAGRLRSRAD